MVKSLVKDNLEKKKKFFIDNIARFCDRCGQPYSPKDLEIIQNNNLSSIIHFSCSSCKTNHIATFIKPIGISNRMPINTDLEIEEIRKFASMRETSLEEVLEVYMYLKNRKEVKI